MSRKISSERIQYAKSLVESGSTITDAAKQIDCSPDVLSLKLRALGVDTARYRSGRGLHAFNRKKLNGPEIIRRYLSGESVLALAKSFGVNRSTITTRLKEANVSIRNGSQANVIRFARMSFDDRRALSKSARDAHMANIMANSAHYSRGPGEFEIATALRELGYDVRTQSPLDNGTVDIAIGNVAVEIKMCSGGSYGFSRKRVKQIRNANMIPLFVGFNHIDCISERLEEIVALIDFACRHPAPLGKHWVIRCRCYDRTGATNIYDTSIERRSDNSDNVAV